jgi:hypothetical protein
MRRSPLVHALLLCLSLSQALGCAGLFSRKAPESVEILNRKDTSPAASVKHILIAWSWLAPGYRKQGMSLDARAENRTQHDAEALSLELLAKLQAGAPIEPLMKEYSEDPGSAASGISYDVTPDSRLAADFIELALRLKVGESGVVKSLFGLHVMQRVK